MKRKIISILLAVILSVCLLPMNILAKDANSMDPVIWTNFNINGVKTGGLKNVALFKFNKNMKITCITTYHWNNAKGKTPGTISIYTKDGVLVGMWNAVSRAGYMNAPNVYWDIYPNVELKANTYYYVLDSDFATWSWNSESKNCGFVELCGYMATTTNAGTSYSWTGTWDSSFNKMYLIQNGNSVTGSYAHDNGIISAVISGNKLRGTWTEDGNQTGKFVFVMSADGKSFTGTWGYDTNQTGSTWNGQRTSKVQEVTANELISNAKKRDYIVTVTTGSGEGDGTDEYVYITLYGTNQSYSEKIELDNPGNDFERGDTNRFNITATDVGEIAYVEILFEEHGRTDPWRCTGLTIDGKKFMATQSLFKNGNRVRFYPV